MLKTKLQKNKLYLSPSENLVRVVVVDSDECIVYNYNSRQNERFNADLIKNQYQPVFLISEVARALCREPTTLRTYERENKIKPARRAPLGPKRNVRIYTMQDVVELYDFFSGQRERRPSKRAMLTGGEAEPSLSRLYQQRFER
jgi:hypothetical protein